MRSRDSYHCGHATYLDYHRPTCGTQPHRSPDHPAHTRCGCGRPNRMDGLSGRLSSCPRGSRLDWMDLDRHGLRYLWNGGIGLRSCHDHKYPGRTAGDWGPLLLQRDERDRKFLAGTIRRARVFTGVPGDLASRIPSSQSSVPFFIRTSLIRINPASVNQAFVSAAV